MLLAVTKAVVDGVLGRSVPVAVDIRGTERASAGRAVVDLTHAYRVVCEAVTEVEAVVHTLVHRIQVAVQDRVGADGVSKVRVADADVHGVCVIDDACLVQKLRRLAPYPHFESGMMTFLGPQPGLCLELERRAETVEKGVDGASLIVVALRIQRGINPEIKVKLTPFLLPQAVFEVGPKGVCVVDVMRQMTVRAVEDLPVFGHAGQQVDGFREA